MEGCGSAGGAVAMAPALYEYDAFGNMTRETLALAEQPAPDNSPIREYAFSVENAEDGIYMVTAQTRYNAEGQPLVSVRKQLLSELSGVLETKAVIIDERGLTSAEWTEYAENTKRIQKEHCPLFQRHGSNGGGGRLYARSRTTRASRRRPPAPIRPQA